MKLPALPPDRPAPIRHWGELFQQLARASGCRTQRQLADQLHVAAGTLNRYLACERLPDDKLVSTLVTLTQANGHRFDTPTVEHAYREAAKAWPPRQPKEPQQAANGRAAARRLVTTALVAVWKRFGRTKTQRVVVLTVLTVAVVAAVIFTVPQIWASSDEPNTPGPRPLLRYQAPTPDRSNFISPTEPGPPGWTTLPPLGKVYAPGENRVPELVPIYRYRCTNCGDTRVYFLSRDSSPRQNFALETEAFRCFDPHNPPAGTRPLQALSNKYHARLWAVPGTSEYQDATANGFKDPNPDGLPLCYIW